MSRPRHQPLLDRHALRRAALGALTRLNPLQLLDNPVIFLVALAALFTSCAWGWSLFYDHRRSSLFLGFIAVSDWLTVLAANFAEALAETGARARAASLRRLRQGARAERLLKPEPGAEPGPDSPTEQVSGEELAPDDLVLVRAGQVIVADGEVVCGIASVNEAAVTGESAPVVREAGGDLSAVTAGTTVASDWLVYRVTSAPGNSFLDRIIAMIESARRRRTPNETALTVLLLSLTGLFVLVSATLLPFAHYAHSTSGSGYVLSYSVLIALLVSLLPTAIGGLLSAVGIAGISRLMRANVIARSGSAVEAAGDVDILFVDKTGTVTFGNRAAEAIYPAPGASQEEAARAAALASLSDRTPEGRSLTKLAVKLAGARPELPADAVFVPFSAQTRMSGVNFGDTVLRKGAPDAIAAHLAEQGGRVPSELAARCDEISSRGATALILCDQCRALAAIELKDRIKPGVSEHFRQLRRMGVRTVMITGDNALTAATIAEEVGVDDYLAEATPEKKLAKVRELQAQGRVVAMTGDGTNDSPALAQADVAMAMNSGTPAAREAANMIDLDSSPAKLISVIRIGKQLLMTRGALTTFSLANDVGKYFAIVPCTFAVIYPGLARFNVMGLASLETALASAVIFNAVMMAALTPLAIGGVPYRPMSAERLFRRNLLIYGLGGLITPFIVIKLLDWLLSCCWPGLG